MLGNSPNESLVKQGLEVAKLYREMLVGGGERSALVSNCFFGLIGLLGLFKLEPEEAEELVPELIEVTRLATSVPVLPQLMVVAAVKQIGEDWLLEEVEQNIWGWSYTFLPSGMLVVASREIIDALLACDFDALASFGGETLQALQYAGVNFVELYREAYNLGEDEKVNLNFEVVSPHSVDCVCTCCRLRLSISLLADKRLHGEDYLAGLTSLIKERADEIVEDEEAMSLALGELAFVLGFFMRTNLTLPGHLIAPAALLELGELLFRGWARWPDFITTFLDRFPPSVAYEDWMEASGWVVMITDRLEILSPEIAEKKRLLIEKEERSLADEQHLTVQIEDALRHFREEETGE